MKLDYEDKGADPAAWASELGISKEAVDLYLNSDVLDLHIETYNWQRLFGYDITKRHGRGPFGARLFGQVDMPRVRAAHLTGGMWSISTNPLRGARARAETFSKNVQRYKGIIESASDDFAVVRNLAEYKAARKAGKHGAFLAVQGGNALDVDLSALDRLVDDLIIRITVLHLYNSRLGTTSTPNPSKGPGLTDFGVEYIKRLNDKKVLVDLAHISRDGFARAVAVHDKSQPLIVTHTGIDAVYPHWRNLTDEQVRAVCDTGGTIGMIYQMPFMGPSGKRDVPTIVDHMQHVVDTFGEDYVSLGSDWDGVILPPRDMPTVLELPIIVQRMLDRGWSDTRIQKILGGNFLRVVGHLRGEA